jgi:hypothetical protein
MLKTLQDSLAVLDVELVPLHEKLVSLRRQMVSLAAKPEKPKSELKQLKEELRKIDSLRIGFLLHSQVHFSPFDSVESVSMGSLWLLGARIYPPHRRCVLLFWKNVSI